MTANIGGALDLRALSRLHFLALDREQQAQAIGRLAATGMTDYDISHATSLAVEMVRRILGEQGRTAA
jgi:hypothetical protein